MKKVLFVATVTRHINAFHIPYLKWFKEQGYEVHVASNGNEKIEYCDKHYNIPFERFPLKYKNIKAYKELKNIIEENKYKVIHCHTPVGGVLARLAAKNSRERYNTKVIYTAHGFHFYKGGPIINWLIYYPLEKWMSQYTDCLITITNEDYEFAKKHLKAEEIKHINGIGMNTERFLKEITEDEKDKLRKELNLSKKDFVFTYVAELNKNKNQILLIKVMEKIRKDYSNIKLLLVGNCSNKNFYEEEINRRNLEKEVMLLGKRNNINGILSITDIYLASSIREGLPVNIMEAMYKGLPIIATKNRGHKELIENDINGFLVNNNENELAERIGRLLKDKEKVEKFKENSLRKIEIYKIENVIKQMEKIYMENL